VLLFVNGLPLVLMELKRRGRRTRLGGAFNQAQAYLSQIPDVFMEPGL
jgi:type I site-specific restriction-modification system R (restriction) subunit